jgi:radical SAM superfamily enzyme YgiQ (UPF0313 family)
VRSRSEQSVLDEAKIIASMPDFKGYIHDVGGPTANFRYPSCDKQLKDGVCPNRKCLAPTPCKNLKVDHTEYTHLIGEIEKIPRVKKVFIRSGIRFDYLMQDKNDAFFRKLVSDNVSGQLKVAPEHCSSGVLRCMGKPDFAVYQGFRKKFFEITDEIGKEQYLVPYLMSSHPGSTLNDAIELALCLKRDHYAPEQVQDYYPTPGTASTVMYYTGINPLDMKPVYVATDYHEKQLQRALLQYNRPQNADLVREALTKAGREDLIGYGEECLVRPANAKGQYLAKPSANGAKKTGTQRNATSRGAKPATKGKPTNAKLSNVKNTSAKSAKPTATRSEKPTYKKGWAKPKAKKSGKKK